jgi:hypothetical protein
MMQFKTTPTILDIEASGFGYDSYPIEVGLVRSDGDRYCALIQPHDDWTYWSDQAEQIHGITMDMLKAKGKPVATVSSELNAFLSGETCYSDAWVQDKAWLSKLFFSAKVSMGFTLSPLESLMTEQQHEIWDEQKKRTMIELNLTRHRASTDAYIIQRTFLESKMTCDGVMLKSTNQRIS